MRVDGVPSLPACRVEVREGMACVRQNAPLGAENDGTDSALEWEEFGASTIGESGNMGVGEVQATVSIYSRRQKGRHFVF